MPSSHSVRLQHSETDIKNRFKTLSTTKDVADILEVPLNQLTYALWRKPSSKRYRKWHITKRNGDQREIHAPTKTHMILQRKVLHVLKLIYRRRSVVHGFELEKSIVTNAKTHVHCRWVLNIDLKDFFPSIHFGRVRGMFIGKPYSLGDKAATALAQLCCHNKCLPQGAPTSPIISTMVCARMDGELKRLAILHGCKYTRYADDLTFSTNKKSFPEELAAAIDSGSGALAGISLQQVVQSNGFEINTDKTRLQFQDTRQEVTGLIVNRRPNVRRNFISQIRAMLHAWETHGYDLSQKEFLAKYDTKHRPKAHSSRIYEKVICGKLAFLKQVRGENNSQYLRMYRRFAQLVGVPVISPSPGITMQYDVFICHASEDKNEVVRPLKKSLIDADIKVWIDEDAIGWGESTTGKINDGLSKSKFVILVLSEAFLKKRWPIKEMNAVLSREISSGVDCALPLMLGDNAFVRSVIERYPLLSDKLYVSWAPDDIGTIVSNLKTRISKSG